MQRATKHAGCISILVPNNVAVAAVSHGGIFTCIQGHQPNW